MISKKVILTGSFGVGKTSLFNQFIYQQFSDKYLTTIGVKVNKKDLVIDDETLTILLWDIAGEVAQDKVPTSYFLGAGGIIYVVDLSRPITFNNMQTDIAFLQKLLPDTTIVIVGNKKDLLSPTELADMAQNLDIKLDFTTSAKTGENIDTLFLELGKKLIANHW
jgi:small GTP-binding protein